MNSLQDSDVVRANLFLPPPVVLLFLPLLVTKMYFVFCQNYHYFFFSKTQLTQVAAQASHWLPCGGAYGRAYGRIDHK